MFCIKCGAENSDEAVFCQKCGNKFEHVGEQETQIARLTDDEDFEDHDEYLGEHDDEEDVFSTHPTLLFVKIGYGLAVLAAFLLAGMFAALSLFTAPISAIVVVVLGLALLLIPAYFHVKQKMIRYTLTDSKLEIDTGLLNKNTRNVPLRIIQDVTVSANFLQRLFGIGNVEIENANETDARVILKNINSPKEHAKTLLKQMRNLNK